MNRRNFLQCAAVAGAASAIPFEFAKAARAAGQIVNPLATQVPIKIDKIILRRMVLPRKGAYRMSFATLRDRPITLVEVVSGPLSGFGECSAFDWPYYNEETSVGAYHVIKNFLIPRLKEKGGFSHPTEAPLAFESVRRNNLAKCAVEGAMWDLYGKTLGKSLSQILGGVRPTVESGGGCGIKDTPEELVEEVRSSVAKGRKRMKLKIEPGRDVEFVVAVRKAFPDLVLTVDANSAYTLKDIDLLKQLDKYNLCFMEQPLACDDIIDHAQLQKAIKTPVCLDESIDTVDDARHAIDLGSCKIINIKIQRVGGLTEAVKIHNLCAQNGIGVWSGGMFDSGVGRANNLALASLPNFIYANDGCGPQYNPDITENYGKIGPDSMVLVPTKPGIGVDVNRDRIEELTFQKEEIPFKS